MCNTFFSLVLGKYVLMVESIVSIGISYLKIRYKMFSLLGLFEGKEFILTILEYLYSKKKLGNCEIEQNICENVIAHFRKRM